MGLPTVHRLQHWQDFQKVYRQGKCFKSKHLSLRAMLWVKENQEEDLTDIPTRFGISISRKVSKKAVIRNKIKRQIRAAIRSLLPHILPNWQIIIIVKPSTSECEYEHFLRELKELLIKSEVINGY